MTTTEPKERTLVDVLTAHPTSLAYYENEVLETERADNIGIADILDRVADGLFAIARAIEAHGKTE